MIIITADRGAGKRVVRTLGLVRGNTIRARHIGKDIMAVMRNTADSEKTGTVGGVHGLGFGEVQGLSAFGLVVANSYLSDIDDVDKEHHCRLRFMASSRIPFNRIGDDDYSGRLSQAILAPSPTRPGTTYPARVSPHSDV